MPRGVGNARNPPPRSSHAAILSPRNPPPRQSSEVHHSEISPPFLTEYSLLSRIEEYSEMLKEWGDQLIDLAGVAERAVCNHSPSQGLIPRVSVWRDQRAEDRLGQVRPLSQPRIERLRAASGILVSLLRHSDEIPEYSLVLGASIGHEGLITFRALTENIQQLRTGRGFLESNLQGQSRRGWEGRSGRKLVPSKRQMRPR
jgi:hypothetical protein